MCSCIPFTHATPEHAEPVCLVLLQAWQATIMPHLKQLQLQQLMRAATGLLSYGHNPTKPWAGLWFVALQVSSGLGFCMCVQVWGLHVCTGLGFCMCVPGPGFNMSVPVWGFVCVYLSEVLHVCTSWLFD